MSAYANIHKHAFTHSTLITVRLTLKHFVRALFHFVLRAQVAALDACSGRWQCRCYLVALHFPLWVCVCVYMFMIASQLWWPAAHFTEALAAPQMVDPDRNTKRGEEHTHALSLMHTHTHSDIHLHGSCLRSLTCSGEERESFYGLFLAWPETFLVQQSCFTMWFTVRSSAGAITWSHHVTCWRLFRRRKAENHRPVCCKLEPSWWHLQRFWQRQITENVRGLLKQTVLSREAAVACSNAKKWLVFQTSDLVRLYE